MLQGQLLDAFDDLGGCREGVGLCDGWQVLQAFDSLLGEALFVFVEHRAGHAFTLAGL